MDKKIGNIVWLYDGGIHKIEHMPEIFRNDRLATEEEIKQYNEIHNS